MSKPAPAPSTPPPAAATVPVVTPPATPAPSAAPDGGKKPEPVAPSTSARLFPGWDEGKKPNAPAPKSPPLKEPTVPATDVLDLEALKGKKLKVKVDGEEQEVAFEDFLKGIQLESHLTRKSQDLTTREQELVEREKTVRKQLDEIIPHLKPQVPPVKVDDPLKDSLVADDPLVMSLIKRLDNQDAELKILRGATAGTVYEQNLKRLAVSVERDTGFKDFLEFKPRLEEAFKKLSPEQKAASDTEEWWTRQFLVMKARDLSAEVTKPKTPPPVVPQRPPAAPLSGLGGADGGPAAPPVNDGWDERYREAFDRARASGSTQDWLAVLRLKEEAKTSR